MSDHLIDAVIVKEIGRKMYSLNELRKDCFVDLMLSNLSEQAIKKESTIHSYKIEYPFVNRKPLPGNTGNGYNGHASAKSVKKGTKRLREAFNWGKENIDLQNVEEHFLLKLATKVDPDYHGYSAMYRQGPVRVGGADWTPPYPAKIGLEMEKYLSHLNVLLKESGISEKDPKEQMNFEQLNAALEVAIYSHLHLVRIHPFSDTNGRTARTLQNVLLSSASLPVPIIYAGERFDYYEHLQKAIWSWRNFDGSDGQIDKSKREGERSLYNYIAGKVSASLDRLVN